MQALIDDFCIYIASEKGLSHNTIEAYQRDIEKFILFIQELGINFAPNVTESHIVSFLTSLKMKNYAVSSICRALISIKVFFRFLKREQIIPSNIALYLETPKLWQLIPDVLSSREVELLLAQPDPATPLGARDRAIIETLYGSGLRVSELCSLNIYDVDDEFVKVYGKGSKERLVPIGKKAIAAIDYYLIHYRCLYESDKLKTLFLSKNGRPIDRIAVWRMIKENAKKARITKNIFPHTLRHSFATHLLDNGADLRIIQEMLGHSSIQSTDRYVHLSKTHIQHSFDKHHPRPSG